MEDCNSASLIAHCDDVGHLYLKKRDGTLKMLKSDSNWAVAMELIITNITSDTVLLFECTDRGYIGGFIATIEYRGQLYSTKNPISETNWNISYGDTSNLEYHSKTSKPWRISDELIENDAEWVWNGQTENTMKFEFDFGKIGATNGDSTAFTCGCNEECTIYCDLIDPINGCSSQIIDGRIASSLNIYCDSSKNRYFGGCQFSTIYCPEGEGSKCNIECNDYYGCYLTTIHASSQYFDGGNTVTLKCANEEGSCLKTKLYANTSSNVNVSCYGGGILGSRDHSACDNFDIHVDDLDDSLYLLCWDDFSCFDVRIHAAHANYINVHARGNMALSTSTIYAQNAKQFDLFCGSEESEYGCYKLYAYNPEYATQGHPKTNVVCQGHGCYDEMYFYSAHGPIDIDISLDGCGECQSIAECVSNWYFYCDYNSFDVFHGDVCDSDHCDCDYGINEVASQWIPYSDDRVCDIFTFDFECPPGSDCIVDCLSIWPDDNGCYDKVINGANATSLTVICNATIATSLYGVCESSHIYAPYRNYTQLSVECNHKESCDDLEISLPAHGNVLSLQCRESDSCQHTNVNADGLHNDIFVECIATDSCNDINVTANYANNVSIKCEGNADRLESYSGCEQMNVWAHFANDVKLVCSGDYSCYSVNIYAEEATHVLVDTIGDYGSYGGHIMAQNASSMSISCKSQYHQYGCYHMEFYIPSQTQLECEGK